MKEYKRSYFIYVYQKLEVNEEMIYQQKEGVYNIRELKKLMRYFLFDVCSICLF